MIPTGILGATLGGHILVSCSGANDVLMTVQWLINGTIRDLDTLPGIDHVHVVSLQFSNIPAEYNGTVIGCIGDGVRTQENTTLLIQGMRLLNTVTTELQHLVLKAS